MTQKYIVTPVTLKKTDQIPSNHVVPLIKITLIDPRTTYHTQQINHNPCLARCLFRFIHFISSQSLNCTGGKRESLSQPSVVSSSPAGSCSELPWAWTPASPSGSAPACYPYPPVPVASAPPSVPGCSSPLGRLGCPSRTTPGGSPPRPPQKRRGRSHKGHRSALPSRKRATWPDETEVLKREREEI